MRRRASAEGLSPRVVAYLFLGPDNLNLVFGSPDDARPTWERHKAGLLRWWAQGFPLTFDANPFLFLGLSEDWPQPGMPWGWWQFSAPEPRRLLSVTREEDNDGTPVYPMRPPTAQDAAQANTLGLGRSTSTSEHYDNARFDFESDESYFSRQNTPRSAE